MPNFGHANRLPAGNKQYGNFGIPFGSDPNQWKECIYTSLSFSYQTVENRNWANAFGQPPADLRPDMIKRQFRVSTELMGRAGRLNNDRDFDVPSAWWESKVFTIHRWWERYGIGIKYYPEEESMNQYEKTVDKMGGLVRILQDAEEDAMADFYLSNVVGGWQSRPMFGAHHGIIVKEDLGISNILPYGRPSYSAALALEQYGQNFLTQEGRIAAGIKPELIVSSPGNISIWQAVYGSEEGATLSARPNLLPVYNLPNPSLSFVFYTGYQESFFFQPYYMGRINQKVEEMPKCVHTVYDSKFRMMFFNPLKVVMLGGMC